MKNAPSFCSFIKKLYLCSKMSCTSMQTTQVCRNQSSCQLITSFLSFPHKLLFLADYEIIPKIIKNNVRSNQIERKTLTFEVALRFLQHTKLPVSKTSISPELIRHLARGKLQVSPSQMTYCPSKEGSFYST